MREALVGVQIFSKIDVEVAFLLIFFSSISLFLYLGSKNRLPTIEDVAELAQLFNTKGGLIILLSSLWVMTLCSTVSFGVWVIVRGIDPQHGVVVTILAMLSSSAFGTVQGALFKTMTGEEPRYIKSAPIQSPPSNPVTNDTPSPPTSASTVTETPVPPPTTIQATINTK